MLCLNCRNICATYNLFRQDGDTMFSNVWGGLLPGELGINNNMTDVLYEFLLVYCILSSLTPDGTVWGSYTK